VGAVPICRGTGSLRRVTGTLFVRGTRITFPREGYPFSEERVPLYRVTGAPLPIDPLRWCPVFRCRVTPYPRDGYPIPKDGYPFSEGRASLFRGTGVPFSQERVPPTRRRPPHIAMEGFPFPEGRLTLSERRVPHYRRTGTPFPGHGFPFSEGLWCPHTEGTGNTISDGRACSLGRKAPFTEACYTFVRWRGGPVPRDGEPFSEECRQGIPFFYPRRMTHRWRPESRPFADGDVEGMDWIR
jgi:hypothetical protein